MQSFPQYDVAIFCRARWQWAPAVRLSSTDSWFHLLVFAIYLVAKQH